MALEIKIKVKEFTKAKQTEPTSDIHGHYSSWPETIRRQVYSFNLIQIIASILSSIGNYFFRLVL